MIRIRHLLAPLALLAALLAAPIADVRAQSSPGLVYGQVPTAAQWNSYFALKQDALTIPPNALLGNSTSSSQSLRYITMPSTCTGANDALIWVPNVGWTCHTIAGGGTINPGAANALPYYALSGNTLSAISSINNGTLITNGSGVPSFSLTLPATVQGNISTVGTISSGAWNATPITVPYGGTGISVFTSGGVPYASSTTTIASSGLLAANGVVIGGGAGAAPATIATANSGTLVTSGGGVPSISSTLPSAVQDNVTRTGTLVSGATGSGFTVALSTSTITGVLGSTHGGAGSITGALKADGAGVVTQAACSDLSNGATGCSTATGTSGATIPLLNGTNTWSGVQSFNSNDLVAKGSSSGTLTLNAAAIAGTNTITFPAGTTDFTATGGASRVLKQVTTGAAITVGTMACADISDAGTGCTTTVGTAASANTGTSGHTLGFLDGANTFSALQTFSAAVTVSSGVLTIPNGAVGAPSLNLGDSTTGLYRSASNQVGVAVSGAQVGFFSSTGLNNTVIGGTTPLAITGTAITGNSFIPNSSAVPTNGVYLPAANTVGISCASAQCVTVSNGLPSGELLVGDTSIRAIASTPLYVVNPGGNNGPTFVNYSGSASAVFAGVFGGAARGTPASPLALGSADGIEAWSAFGYDGTAWSGSQADIFVTTTQAWSVGAHGTQMAFRVTPTGSTTIATALTLAQDKAATFAASATATGFIPSSSSIPTNGLYLPASNNPGLSANSTKVVDWTTSNFNITSAATSSGQQLNFLAASLADANYVSFNFGKAASSNQSWVMEYLYNSGTPTSSQWILQAYGGTNLITATMAGSVNIPNSGLSIGTTTTQPQGGFLVTSSAALLNAVARSIALDPNNSGQSIRFFGVDASTNSSGALITQRSDGSNAITLQSWASTGIVSFPQTTNLGTASTDYVTVAGSSTLPAISTNGGGLSLASNSGNVYVSHASLPNFYWNATGLGSDLKKWSAYSISGSWNFQAVKDDESASTTAYTIARGTTYNVASHTWYTSTSAGTPVQKLQITTTAATFANKIGVNTPGGATAAVAVGSTTQGGIAIEGTTGISGYTANTFFIDVPSASTTRFSATGADASTNGLYSILSTRSDGSNSTTVLSTDASVNVTSARPWTLSNTTIKLTGLTTGTNADDVCLQSDGQVVIQTSTCTISSRRFKIDLGAAPFDPAASLRKLDVAYFRYKGDAVSTRDVANSSAAQLGLYAEDVAAAIPGSAIYEPDGVTVKSFRPNAVMGALVGGWNAHDTVLQAMATGQVQLRAANDDLRAANDDLRHRIESLEARR